jgi:hypothetical protein
MNLKTHGFNLSVLYLSTAYEGALRAFKEINGVTGYPYFAGMRVSKRKLPD